MSAIIIPIRPEQISRPPCSLSQPKIELLNARADELRAEYLTNRLIVRGLEQNEQQELGAFIRTRAGRP